MGERVLVGEVGENRAALRPPVLELDVRELLPTANYCFKKMLKNIKKMSEIFRKS